MDKLLILLVFALSCNGQQGYLGLRTEPVIGNIFNVPVGPLSSGLFSRTGTSGTFNYTSNGLEISGTGTGLPDNFIEYSNWYSDIEKSKTEIKFTPISDGNGIGIGYVGSNTRYYYGRVVLTGSEKGQLRFDAVQSGIVTNRVNSGTSYFNVVNGQEHTLTLERKPDTIYLTISNSSGSQILKYPQSYANSSTFDSYKAGRIGLFWLGGAQTVKNFSYSTPIRKNPKLLLTGDSNMQGAFAGSYSGRYGTLLQNFFSDRIEIVSGAGNASGDIVALLPEILLINPSAVLVNIGTNGINSGDLNTICSTLQNNGIRVYLMTIFPTGCCPNTTGNTIIRAKSGVTLIDIDATLLNGTSALYTAYNSGDGVHLSSAGNTAVFDYLKTQLAGYLR